MAYVNDRDYDKSNILKDSSSQLFINFFFPKLQINNKKTTFNYLYLIIQTHFQQLYIK